MFLKNNPENFDKFYGISINDDVDNVVEQVGKKKNYLLKGNKIDDHRTCSDIVRDWQAGRLRL